jgi:signal transduction histidine kinase
VERERALFDAKLREDAAAHAATLAHAVEAIVTSRGVDAAANLVRRANARKRDMLVRWVSLEEAPASLAHPVVPLAELENVQAGQRAFRRLPARNRVGALLAYTPVPALIPGEGRTAIELEASLGPERRFVHRAIVRTAASAGALFALAALVSAVFGLTAVARPLRQLLLKARRAGTGDLSGPVLLRQRDEIRDLADEFNAMCDRLAEAGRRVEAEYTGRIAALEQVRRADRLATVGQLAAGIAHELGTPLGVIAGRAKMIAAGETSDVESRESAAIVVGQADRLTSIIRQLLDFARKQPPQKRSVDLATLARETVELLGPLAQKRDVELIVVSEQPGAVHAAGDAGQLQQVVTNLVVNAIQAATRRVEISCHRTRRKPPPDHGGNEADWVGLRITDDGRGMDAETMEHVFEPFFTTKEVGQGSGLGLSVAHGIVRDHGGWIDVGSEVGQGSWFTIYLAPEEVRPS